MSTIHDLQKQPLNPNIYNRIGNQLGVYLGQGLEKTAQGVGRALKYTRMHPKTAAMIGTGAVLGYGANELQRQIRKKVTPVALTDTSIVTPYSYNKNNIANFNLNTDINNMKYTNFSYMSEIVEFKINKGDSMGLGALAGSVIGGAAGALTADDDASVGERIKRGAIGAVGGGAIGAVGGRLMGNSPVKKSLSKEVQKEVQAAKSDLTNTPKINTKQTSKTWSSKLKGETPGNLTGKDHADRVTKDAAYKRKAILAARKPNETHEEAAIRVTANASERRNRAANKLNIQNKAKNN